ncbi:hypothetical protein JKG47_09410 [Acidithiobacillus sp. MC6.1]|nr:hypothetical protein [Acidithiobacillus sp. MC6.1]
MTRSSGANPLRPLCHGTPGCLPVPDPAAVCHAVVSGETAKADGMTSTMDMSKANITGSQMPRKE